LSLLGIAVGTLVGVVILGGIVVWRLAERSQSVIATQPTGQPTTASDATLRPKLVEMELQGLPDGARVRLDNRLIKGTTIRGLEGSAVTLSVISPSFEPLRMELTFTSNQDVDLSSRLRPVQPEPIVVEEQLLETPSKRSSTSPPRRRGQTKTTSAPPPSTKASSSGDEVADPWNQ
jgi:hypothetical protein